MGKNKVKKGEQLTMRERLIVSRCGELKKWVGGKFVERSPKEIKAIFKRRERYGEHVEAFNKCYDRLQFILDDAKGGELDFELMIDLVDRMHAWEKFQKYLVRRYVFAKRSVESMTDSEVNRTLLLEQGSSKFIPLWNRVKDGDEWELGYAPP